MLTFGQILVLVLIVMVLYVVAHVGAAFVKAGCDAAIVDGFREWYDNYTEKMLARQKESIEEFLKD